MTAPTPGRPDFAGVFDQHQYAEFVLHDAGKVMETMVEEPSVRHGHGLDLDTFLTAVYAVVDDLYRERLAAERG